MVNKSFLVWHDEDEDESDASKIEAHDAEEAAEKWAEEDDWTSAEYQIVSQQSEPVVCVKDADGKVTRWKVTGEGVPTYYAKEQPAQPEPEQ